MCIRDRCWTEQSGRVCSVSGNCKRQQVGTRDLAPSCGTDLSRDELWVGTRVSRPHRNDAHKVEAIRSPEACIGGQYDSRITTYESRITRPETRNPRPG